MSPGDFPAPDSTPDTEPTTTEPTATVPAPAPSADPDPAATTDPAAPTPPTDPTPPAAPTDEPPSSGNSSTTSTASAPAPDEPAPTTRSRVKTVFAAALGIVLSTVLAGFVTTYFDVWSSSRSPVPAGRGVHAESEVWWDLTRDYKAVRLKGPVDTEKLERNYPDGDAALDGLVEGGGVYAGMERIRLTLMNFTKVPVSITGVRARVTAEEPVSEGSLLSCGGPQGGIDITRVRIDLGSPTGAAQEYDGKALVGQYPTQQVQLAKQDEPAIFDILVVAGKTTASYVLDVDYQQGTDKGRIVVDQSGKPFVLAPAEGDARAKYHCDSAATGWKKNR